MFLKKSTQISYKKCLIYLLKCYTIDLLFRFKDVTVKMCDTEEFDSKIKRVLITEDEIKAKIAEVGAQISREYEGKPLLLVSILNGAFVFMADLCRAITIPCETAFMCAKSYYNGTSSSGIVKITMDLMQDISGYHVIIAEDIIDTGRTLKILQVRKPASIRLCTLLDKPERRLVKLDADISLFTIPDHFVIGYGLDCGEIYRNLPYIAEYDEGEEV